MDGGQDRLAKSPLGEGAEAGERGASRRRHALAKHGGSLGDLKSGDIYQRDALTAPPGLDVMELRRAMLERHARYVPVMEGTTLQGVVSFHDVAKAVYEEQSFENRMLKNYIKDWPEESPA